MRNLTILRRKSFVGCAMKDHVYIRDEAGELTIDGVACRKIGEIKNGEEKTFAIGEDQQQIFLITDKLSKDYCNASMTIPQGQEDVHLSGAHKFVLGSNPFRFDGVTEVSPKQKKNGRIGLAITVAAAVLGLVAGFGLTRGLMGGAAEPQVFTREDFSITLTDAFEQVEQPGFFAAYTSKTAMVFVVREDAAALCDVSLEEYGQLVLEANGFGDKQMQRADGFCWFDYTLTPQSEELYYLAACMKGADSYWVVSFATPVNNQEDFREFFLQWAASVSFE